MARSVERYWTQEELAEHLKSFGWTKEDLAELAESGEMIPQSVKFVSLDLPTKDDIEWARTVALERRDFEE